MARPTDEELIEELRKFDTPSITNVVATYPGHPLCLAEAPFQVGRVCSGR